MPSARMPRSVLVGLALLLAGLVLGGGLVAYGSASLRQPAPVVGQVEVLAEEAGEQFSIYRVGEASAEACRVTTGGGMAVPVVRAPGTSTLTIDARAYTLLAVVEAPGPGTLVVDCSGTPGLFVAKTQPVSRNVVAVVGGFVLGGVLGIAGAVMALIGAVTARGRRRHASHPPQQPGHPPAPPSPPPGA